MAWEYANKFFPLGIAPLPDGNVISVDDLKKSKIKVLYKDLINSASLMVTKKERYVWSAENQFARIEKYNVHELLPHSTETIPLNIYGINMINNYLKLNCIELEDDVV